MIIEIFLIALNSTVVIIGLFSKFARICKSLIAYNFCYECARDLISSSVDEKYEIINEIDKNFENRPIITTVAP